MPRFLTGDELGNIKSLRYTGNNTELETIHDGLSTGKLKSIQALSVTSTSEPDGTRLVRNIHSIPWQGVQDFIQGKIAAAHADGYISTSILQDDDQLEPLHEWKETRFKADQRYVGLSASNR